MKWGKSHPDCEFCASRRKYQADRAEKQRLENYEMGLNSRGEVPGVTKAGRPISELTKVKLRKRAREDGEK